MKTRDVYLPNIVGKGYAKFWRFKGRYRVVKGSRASKKSKTAALWFIYNMMKPEYSQANAVVFRKTYRTIRDSCFADLLWAQKRLGVEHLWDCKISPLEMTYLPTGQKILFRGLDDVLKITSLSVENGFICWAWLEEAYEVLKQEDFEMLDESIRGAVPSPLFKQWTISFNPWNERHWLKSRFFDVKSGDILAMTTTYQCNEWLDDSDRNLFENMKVRNPRRYQVAGLGNWGIVDGLVYENWDEQEFSEEYVQNLKMICGLDFGFTNDPTAFFVAYVDEKKQELFVWDEFYETGLINKQIAKKIQEMGYEKALITADSAEPKSIKELKELGLKVQSARKGPDSIRNGIQFIQGYRIFVHPRCVNFMTEISNYTWDKDRFGNTLNQPVDDFNHLMDAMRYAFEDIQRGGVKIKTFKGGI